MFKIFRSQNVEEIALSKKSVIEKEYKKAYELYVNKDPVDIATEKVKLEKIIESNKIELSFTGIFIALVSLVISISVQTIYKLLNFYDLIISAYFCYVGVVLVALIAYSLLESKYKKNIFNSRICLKALTDIEQKNKRKEQQEEMQNLINSAINEIRNNDCLIKSMEEIATTNNENMDLKIEKIEKDISNIKDFMGIK